MQVSGKILLISDDKTYANAVLKQVSSLGGYTVVIESTVQAGVVSLVPNHCEIVLIKYSVLQIDTPSLINEFKRVDPDVIIIVLFSTQEQDKALELLEMGIYDYLIYPEDVENLRALVEKGIKQHLLLVANRRFTQGLRESNQALEKQNMVLARRIEDATTNLSRLYEDLRSTYMRTIRVLAQAIDARDHYTHSHSENVARIAVAIANYLKLAAKDIEILRQACELHDLGKIGLEDSILLKTTPLTDLEWEQIRKHPAVGAQILEPLTFLNGVVDLVRQHHEHYNGLGYPEGRKGDDILLGARIIHVADAYEAMRSARSYRKIPLSKEDALLEIKRNSGTQFDPKIVDAFLRIVNDL